MMKRYLTLSLMLIGLNGAPLLAGDQSLDAAVGGALGGGLGAFVGSELGGRNGAILGGGLGGAAGAAIATDDDRGGRYVRPPRGYAPSGVWYAPPSRFCPPGQAKKGRC
ncbi:MAG: hypothetical protein ACM3ST_01715 [Bdellovibrio bacteriovorus]